MSAEDFQRYIDQAKADRAQSQRDLEFSKTEEQKNADKTSEQYRLKTAEIRTSANQLVSAVETFLYYSPNPNIYEIDQLENHGSAPMRKTGNFLLGAIARTSNALPYIRPQYNNPARRGLLESRDISQTRAWFNGNKDGVIKVEYALKGWMLGLSRYDYKDSETVRDSMNYYTDNLGLQVFLGKHGNMLLRPTVIANVGSSFDTKLNPDIGYTQYSSYTRILPYPIKPKVIKYEDFPNAINSYLDLTSRQHRLRGGPGYNRNPAPPIPHPTVEFYDSLQTELAQILVKQEKV